MSDKKIYDRTTELLEIAEFDYDFDCKSFVGVEKKNKNLVITARAIREFTDIKWRQLINNLKAEIERRENA